MEVSNTAATNLLYALKIDFTSMRAIDSLEEKVFPSASSAVAGITNIEITGSTNKNDNVFLDTAKYPLDELVSTLNTRTAKAIVVTPSDPISSKNNQPKKNSTDIKISFGTTTTPGMELDGFVFNIPKFKSEVSTPADILRYNELLYSPFKNYPNIFLRDSVFTSA